MVNYQIVSKDGKIVEKNLFFGKNDKDSLNKIIPKVDDIVFNNWDFEGDEKIIKIDNDYDWDGFSSNNSSLNTILFFHFYTL